MSMRPPTTIFKAMLATAMLAALPVGTASAADLDYGFGSAPPPVVTLPESKVEFGSGWYIRGDVGAARVPKLQLNAPNLPTAPANYQFWDGVQPGAPGVVFGGGSSARLVGSLGAGYQVNRFLRGDIMFDYHQPTASNGSSGSGSVFCPTAIAYNQKTPSGTTDYTMPTYGDGECTGYYKAHVSSYDVLVNGYIDLGTWYHVTPYIGAGVGLSFGHYQTSSSYLQANGAPYQVTYTDPQFGSTTSENFDRNASGTYYNFAFAGMAGIAIDIYPHTKLDLGYRYLNLGHIASLGGTLYEHEARAGLRYMIDN